MDNLICAIRIGLRRVAETCGKRPLLRRLAVRSALVVVTLPGMLANVHAAQQCFFQAGTYGALTVTTTGPGCGTSLTFGGITGVWLGDTNVTENCQFNLSPAVTGNTISVAMTAHSCIGGNCEEARFSLNGAHYAVQPADLDNTTPTGGQPLIINGAGDIDMAPGTDDGRGTITFHSAPASVNSININHVILSGSPNGTIYRVCANDAPQAPPTPTVIPTLTEWGLYALGLLLLLAGAYALRRRFRFRA